MKALIFAAGKGERMRPLTDHTPKPLLEARGKPLIVYHIEKLAALGVREIIINTSWLAEQFPARLGDGSSWGVKLIYSYEGPEPLETGGGMLKALSALGDAPFIAINGDIWTDFDLSQLPQQPTGLAHLVMVDNPAHHPKGDFSFSADTAMNIKDNDAYIHGRLVPSTPDDSHRLTFAGIGIYRPAILADWQTLATLKQNDIHTADLPAFKLAPLLVHAIGANQITATHYRAHWVDIGTPDRLASI